jgi:hypothetical protein
VVLRAVVCRGPALGGWESTKTAEGEGAEEKDTVRGTNGVVKGIAVKGRMITENSLQPHERQHVGTTPGLAGRCDSSLGSGTTESSAARAALHRPL